MNNSDPPIKWFAISAKAYNRLSIQAPAGILYSQFNFIPNKWLNTNCLTGQKPNFIYKVIANEDPVVQFEYNGKKYKSYQCDNAVACVEPGTEFAFDKHVTLEYTIKKYFTEYPKLIIFVDDNAKNVMTVYNHFKNKQDNRSKVICVLYEPEKKEDDHDYFMPSLTQEMQKIENVYKY